MKFKKLSRKLVAFSILSMSAFGLIGCEKVSESQNKVQTIESSLDKETLVVGLDDAFPPMGFLDENGEIVGFDIDFAKAMSEELGIELEFQTIDWSMKEAELNAGNIDFIWNGYSITEERKEQVDFSVPYLTNQQIILTLADSPIMTKGDLKDKVVGAQNGSTAVDAIESEPEVLASFKDGKIITYENNNDVLMDLEAGRLDAVVADEILIRYYISKMGEEKFKILEENFGKEEYGVGMRKGDTALVTAFNEAYEELQTNGTMAELSERWFGENITEGEVEEGVGTYAQKMLPQIMEGLSVTFKVFSLTLVLSIALGIVVALCRLSKWKVLSKLTEGYTLLMRGTPLLLQIIFIFFGFPILGITIDRMPSVILAFTLNYAAYFAEIFRAGINAIDEGQYEGAEVLGLSKVDTFFRIILPQAFKRVLPPVTNEVITLVKDTALVYAVGLNDLLRIGRIATNRDATLLPLIIVALIYLLLIFVISKLMAVVEKRFDYYR